MLCYLYQLCQVAFIDHHQKYITCLSYFSVLLNFFALFFKIRVGPLGKGGEGCRGSAGLDARRGSV